MGTPMMARGRRKSLIAVVCVAAIAVFFLSACGVSEEENNRYVQTLEERGFINPVLTNEKPDRVWYDVTVGTCRISVWSTLDGWDMSVPENFSADVKPSQLSVEAIKAHANEFGLEYCFGS